MTGKPYFKFYPRDFMGHPEYPTLSRSARSMLVELLCLAHQQTPPGTIRSEYLAGHLAGDTEAMLLIEHLAGKGIIHYIPGTRDIVMRRLTRDHQRSVDGGTARLRRRDLAGDLPGKTRTTRSHIPDIRDPEQARAAPSKPVEPAEPKTQKKKGPHVEIVETFQRAHASYKHDLEVTRETPIDSIPLEIRYMPPAKDWVAADRMWKQLGGDMALIRRRMANLFESTAEWTDRPSIALLWSHWSDLEKPIEPFTNGNGKVPHGS